MKKLLLFFILFCYFNLYSQNENKFYEISPRVGKEIDNYEKTYFGLFRGFDNFHKANIYKENDDRYRVTINLSKDGSIIDTTYFLDEKMIKLISYYIENFENMYNLSDNPMLKDSLLWKQVIPRFRYFPNKISWIDYNFKIHTKQYLYYDSTFIVLWNNDSCYNWKNLDENIQIVFYNQINLFEGLYVKSDFDYFNEVCSNSKSNISFVDYYRDNSYIPKELKEYVNLNNEKFMGSPEIDSTNIYIPRPPLRYRNYFFICYNKDNLTYSSNNKVTLNTFSNMYGDERHEKFSVELPKKSITLSVETNLYFAPIFLYGYYANDPNSKSGLSDISIDFTTIGLGLIYRLDQYFHLPVSYYNFFPNNKIFFQISLGTSFRKINITDHLKKMQINTDYHGYPYSYNNNATDLSIDFGIGTGFSIIQGLFLKAQIQYSHVVETQNLHFFNPLEWQNNLSDRIYWQSEKTDIRLLTFKYSFGISYSIDMIFTYF